jgi:tetratricopeptide (TPR) repeat protein
MKMGLIITAILSLALLFIGGIAAGIEESRRTGLSARYSIDSSGQVVKEIWGDFWSNLVTSAVFVISFYALGISIKDLFSLLPHWRNVSFPAGIIGAAALTLLTGLTLFYFRLRWRAIYGITEACAGCAIAAYYYWKDPRAFFSNWEFYIPLLTAGAYLVVRGIDNVHQGLTRDPVDPVASKYFRPRTPMEIASDWTLKAFNERSDPHKRLLYATEAIKINSTNPYSYIYRGDAHREKGNKEAALQDYAKAISLTGTPHIKAEAYTNRGILRAAHGDVQGSMEDYMEALRIEPEWYPAFLQRGNLRRDQGDTHGAMQDYADAERLQPEYYVIYLNRGDLLRDNGDTEAALKDYAKAMRLRKDIVQTWYSRGVLWQGQGYYNRAIADFEKYLEKARRLSTDEEKKVKELIRDLKKRKKQSRP